MEAREQQTRSGELRPTPGPCTRSLHMLRRVASCSALQDPRREALSPQLGARELSGIR